MIESQAEQPLDRGRGGRVSEELRGFEGEGGKPQAEWIGRYNPPVKVREVLNLLKKDGWKQVRMHGSHRQLRHPEKSGTVTVAGKLSAEMPPGTLNSVLKQAGLK